MLLMFFFSNTHGKNQISDVVADADTAGNIVCDPGRNMNIGGVVNDIDRDEMFCGINPNHIVSDVDTVEVGSDVIWTVSMLLGIKMCGRPKGAAKTVIGCPISKRVETSVLSLDEVNVLKPILLPGVGIVGPSNGRMINRKMLRAVADQEIGVF
ncbi:hypothetical protein RRG08_050179 [Elysia crispata]|uniref:Uncharacterized protein n=1 Tax=Elysia crispata TaxID=231223 RepID=A0AAE1DBG7_9GAST|nr:hypothetical protein RRG08_050179 [Elysia crispata]